MRTKTYFVRPNLIRSLLVANGVNDESQQHPPLTAPWMLIGVLWLMAHSALAQIDGFTNSFTYSDGTTYNATLCANDMGNCHYWDNTQNSQVYDENLRIRFEANKPGTNSGITAKLNVNGDRVYSMEYRIKFDNEFQWREGGKLPGLAGAQAPSGGTPGVRTAKDGNGFSTRFMWRSQGKLVIYAYYRDMPLSNGTVEGTYGEDWDCNFSFQSNTWYTLKQKVTVNTGSNADGRVEVWVDGVKKLDKSNVRLMTNNNGVDVVFFDTFMGGSNTDKAWSPTRTQYLRIDDVKVVKGGEAPAPAEPDAIVSITAPGAVTPGEVANVEVNYFASTGRDLQVDLQGNGNPDYSPYGSSKVAVPAGEGTVVVQVPVDPSIPVATDAYQFQVYLSPTGLGWDQHTINQTYGDVDAIGTAPPPGSTVDTLYSTVVPKAIIPATTTSMTVHYETSVERDLYIVLQPDIPNFRPQYINVKTSLPSGKNSIEIPLSIPTHIPIAQDAYQFQVYLTPVGMGWFDRLHNIRTGDIDAVVSLPPSEPNNPPAQNPTETLTAVGTHGQLQVEGNRIKDECGRVTQLQGMSYFWHQWERSSEYMNSEVMQWLRDDWKVEMVRIPIGVHPDDACSVLGTQTLNAGQCQGGSNPGGITGQEWAYSTARTAIQAAIDNGLYVIVDWHSHNIYPNEAKEFFTTMAQEFGDNPHVIYEIFNEPDAFNGVLDETWPEIKAHAQEMIAAIRAYDPDNLIVVGTPHWDQFLDLPANDPITTDSNGDPVSNIAYTLHVYAGQHQQSIRDRANVALNNGLAIFMTENGRTGANGNDGIDAAEWDRWVSWANEHGISYAMWSLTIKNEGSAALLPSASPSGNWDYNNDLTSEGRWYRDHFRSVNSSQLAACSEPIPPPSGATGAVSIRAKGSVGSEQMSLLIDGQVVQSWRVATAPDNYVYEGYAGGALSVRFDNDGSSTTGADLNLAVNYIQVCGVKYESNAPGVVRTGCGVDNDQGFAWLWCSGSFDFGNLNCTTNARQARVLPKTTASGLFGNNSFVLYPNPATEQLILQGTGTYQVKMYDLSGQLVMSHQYLNGKAQLDIRHLRPGVYVVEVNTADSQQQPLPQRIIVE